MSAQSTGSSSAPAARGGVDYSRFNNITDDALASTAAGTRFDFGDGNFVARDVMFVKSEDVRRAKALPQEEREVWQITVKRLRCWAPWPSAPGGPPIPVRPYCVLVGCLYPTGRLVKHDICNPPDAPPGCPRLLALLLSAMHNPAGEGVPAHRPGKVTFTDAALAGGCAKSLSALGVETSVLSEAAGFPDYVRGLSKALCMKGSAAVSAACDRPGLLASGSVSEPLARAFFLLADEFARKQPWMRMWERQTVRIRLGSAPPSRFGGGGAGGGVAWVAVLGESSLRARAAAASKGVPPDRLPAVVRGICVFHKRYDAENRIMSHTLTPPGPPPEGGGPPPKWAMPPHVMPHPSDLVCAAAGCGRRSGAPTSASAAASATGSSSGSVEGDAMAAGAAAASHTTAAAGAAVAAAGAPALSLCTRCRDVLYCSRECQKADYPIHAEYCKRNAVKPPGPDGRYWGDAESVCLFERAEALPLDDHEALDKWALSGEVPSSPLDYPVALSFMSGRATRPDAGELLWLMRGMATILAMIPSHSTQLMELAVPMREEALVDLARAQSTLQGGQWYDAIPGVAAAAGSSSSVASSSDSSSSNASGSGADAAAGTSRAAAGAPPSSPLAVGPLCVWARTDPMLTREESIRFTEANAAATAAEAAARRTAQLGDGVAVQPGAASTEEADSEDSAAATGADKGIDGTTPSAEEEAVDFLPSVDALEIAAGDAPSSAEAAAAAADSSASCSVM